MRSSKKRKVPNAALPSRFQYCPGDRQIKASFRRSKPRQYLTRAEQAEQDWKNYIEDED